MTVRELSAMFGKDAIFDMTYSNGCKIRVNNDRRRFRKYLDYTVTSEICIEDDGSISFSCRKAAEGENEIG